MEFKLNIRHEAPEDEVKNALHKLADMFPRLGPPNLDGHWILWSDSAWNCGTLEPARADVMGNPLPTEAADCTACAL